MQIKLVGGKSAYAVILSGELAGAIQWPAVPADLHRVWGVLDVDGVRTTRPRGLRNFHESILALPCKRRLLVRVRPELMAAFSLMPQLLDDIEIASFYAPYVCARCETEHEALIDLRIAQAAVRALTPPFIQCPECGGPSAFDDDPTLFFAPVANAPPLELPDGINAFLEEPRAGRAPPTTAELDVAEYAGIDVTAIWLGGTLDQHAPLTRVVRSLNGAVVLIAADVHATTARGLDACRDVLLSLRHVWLARVSPVLAQGLATTLNGWGNSQVASLRLPFRCDQCEETILVDVDMQMRQALASNEPGNCPKCKRPLTAAFGERELMTLHTIPLARPPAAVAGYLAAHVQPPSADRQREWTQVLPTSFEHPADVSVDRMQPASLSPSMEQASQQKTRYQIVRRLGIGGMAETLLGRQVGIGGFEKRVVIKHILPALADKPAFVDMFLHEARTAARIDHSNVVQIFDFGRSKDQYYIVMEFVRGNDLAAILRAAQKSNRQFPIELAVRIVSDLCAGLAAAHNARDEHGSIDPIIHRDVSPHNLLISSDGVVKLADFGIAKASSSLGATKPGEIKGKVLYMAPEILRNEVPTVKVDIYAAGLILYTLLAGKNPYQRGNEIQSMYAVAHEGLPPIIAQRRDVPFSLAAVLGRAVNRDPATRFPSAQMMQLHLEAFLGEFGRPATGTHLALWVNELMTMTKEKETPDEGTPSSSLEMLELGTLVPGDDADSGDPGEQTQVNIRSSRSKG